MPVLHVIRALNLSSVIAASTLLLIGTVRAEGLAQPLLPQPLASALESFAKQAGLQLVYGPEVARGVESRGASAGLSAQETLKELLRGTGLTFEFVNEHTVTIVRDAQAASAERTAGTQSVAPGRESLIRLAQGEAAGGQNQAAPAAPAPEQALELEEVVVTGTHIRGSQNNTSAVTVLDRAYIDSTGISTAAGLIESLPQNFALASQSGVFVQGVSDSGQQGASINLRALGEGTTLVLLNGHRMAPGFSSTAVDISTLPLSAIERVEILTDGASALYGSDAVGGVVNFILRRDFKGAETRLRSGWAQGGVNEYRVSQALGNTWGSGNALLSLEYYKRDLLRSSERDFVPSTALIGSLFPGDENYSAMLSGRQQLTEDLSVFLEGLYTKRDSHNEMGLVIFDHKFKTKNPQSVLTAGLDWRLPQRWGAEASVSQARYKADTIGRSQLFTDFGLGSNVFNAKFRSTTAQLKADGPVFTLPGGDVRVALGAEWRSDSFDRLGYFSGLLPLGIISFRTDTDQIVRSAFAEVHLPLVDSDNARSGMQRLELSLSARLDDYSSFGSSVDPRVALMWEPLGGLRLRTSYGTSYRAPNLLDYDVSGNSAILASDLDPESSTGFSNVFSLLGTDTASLTAQESENFSFGVEFTPTSVQGLRLAANYYKIDFDDRINSPPGAASVILSNPASFGDLILREPTPQEAAEFIASANQGQGFFVCDPDCVQVPPGSAFDTSTIDVIVDGRKRNMSSESTSGVDVAIDYSFAIDGGNVSLGLAGTRIFELEQQLSSRTVPFDSVDTFSNPPDFRLRGSAAWQRGGWAANLFVNHTDSYTDNRGATPMPIASYTTVDARIAYDFKERIDSGFLSGVTLAASAQNLFDRDPPRTAALVADTDLGFDPTNANPMGRFLALEAVKTW